MKDLVIKHIKTIRLTEVIEIEYVAGEGINTDPVRVVKEYWTKDGKRLCVYEF